MDTLLEHFGGIDWGTLIGTSLRVLLALIIGWILMAVIRLFTARAEQRLMRRTRTPDELPTEASKRVETLMRLVRQAAYVMLWVTILLMVLKEVGVEIAPVLASAGILGLAVGFGAQNLVRDIITGFFFILENQVRVGDVAIVNGTGGLVERINFRTIVLRDLQGTVHIFPNGTVTTLSNMTQVWSAYVFDIGVAYKEDTDLVIEHLKAVGAELRADGHFGPLIIEDMEIFGVDALADSAVIIKGRLKTKPIQQWAVGREFLRRVKYRFDKHGIEIPFPHRTLYVGEATKPLDVALMEKREDRGKDAARES